MRIAFTGPESCGKSTLSIWCAEHFRLPLSEEFAREYLVSRPSYELADLDLITIGQWKDWTNKGPHLVADTEMTVMKIWSEVRFQFVSPEIEQAYKLQQFDHYFLCAPDIPWEADELRENPFDREVLFALYKQALENENRSFTILSGDLETRQKVIMNVLKDLLIS